MKITAIGADDKPAFRDARPVSLGFPVQALSGESGLLWAINRYVFHPRGFALAVSTNTDDLELWGDGTECWQFDPETDDSGRLAFEATLFRLREEWQSLDVPDERGET